MGDDESNQQPGIVATGNRGLSRGASRLAHRALALAAEMQAAGGASAINSPPKLVLKLDAEIGMEFLLVPPGEFLMGNPVQELDCNGFYQTLHRVKITKPFMMATTPVSRRQFEVFSATSGYKTDLEKVGFHWCSNAEEKVYGWCWRNGGFDRGHDDPVVMVSWNDATAFCEWLSHRAGKGCRLPTEAEWEYACRAGSQMAYPWGDNEDEDDYKAIWSKLADKYRRNAFGLYDMICDTWQWCSDLFGPYPAGTAVDPHGPGVGDADSSRVIRGGHWSELPEIVPVYHRNKYAQADWDTNIGFRVCFDIHAI